MSKSVVPAAAVAHAKRLVQNKKLAKHHEDQQPVQDDPQAVGHKDEAANLAVHDGAQSQQLSMSDATLGGFSFSSALTDAASSVASLTAVAAQEEGGYSDGDKDGSGTILLVGAVALVGAGIAVLAGGGGKGNEAPTITSGATATVAENAVATTVVYTTTATDPDGDTLTYSLTGTDAALFNISNAGVVTLKAPADFETKGSYAINVVASDGELTATKAVAVTVTNVTGETPVFTSGATASIAENSATTVTVYDANVTGAGAAFALGGADAAFFNIDAATGIVTFKASPDFETRAAYAIAVTATQDGGTATQNVAVSVTNVVEPGPVFTSLATATTPENVPTSTIVYDAAATGGTIVYALAGTDGGSFNINPATGEVTFKASPDFETKPSYDFNVTATDANGTSTQHVVLTITDIPGEPVTTTFSLDDISTPTTATTVDAGTASFHFTDNAAKTSNIVITNFTNNDHIDVSGIASLGTFSYTTGSGAGGGNDLRIDYQDTTTNAVTSIIIQDALVNAGPVFSYATAMSAVGFDFLTIA